MRLLQLLGTSACHLCELAEAVLANQLAQGYEWEVELIDIADNDHLLDQYGEKIPVLRDTVSGKELNWPFDEASVLSFIGACEG
ncbi:Glutaredoxin-like domain (DUF836) [Spongiibacter sp. IMCC21906]|uniref:glutaredoxin family protein n=1 Tax=Spongiibacter sp. IMCC21906 TaxID=1620392 RepID=UPI00062E00A8|nr:glutaredoxin family protein [Spongiibacter sp. IMCC21906]AKH69743.1 Glutaredoxin-like domain (DUF836) [Spongiibacter sp. IMCC21906]